MSNRIRSSFVAASLLAGLCLPVCSQEAPPPAAPAAVPAPANSTSAAPLTLEECVQRALEHGFDIEIQRYNPAYAKDAVDVARGAFSPTISLNGSQSHSNTGPVGGEAGIKADARDARLSATELLKTGTTVAVSTDLSRSASNPSSLFSFYNPVYNSDLTVTVTQPLLRGAGTTVTTATLNRARIGQTRAGYDFHARVLDVVQETEAAYYSLVYAREQLLVFQMSLDLANRLLEEAQAKKTVGTATDIDVLQAQVGVANARSNVLSGEKSTKDTADALLALIGRFELDTSLGKAKFDDFTGQLPVIESSYQLALHNQPDYISARMQLDQMQLDLAVAKNSLQPTVNLDGILGFNGPRGSASDAFNATAERDNNSWEVDLTVSYPWGRISDKARYRQSLGTEHSGAGSFRGSGGRNQQREGEDRRARRRIQRQAIRPRKRPLFRRPRHQPRCPADTIRLAERPRRRIAGPDHASEFDLRVASVGGQLARTLPHHGSRVSPGFGSEPACDLCSPSCSPSLRRRRKAWRRRRSTVAARLPATSLGTLGRVDAVECRTADIVRKARSTA
jgi:outer membrane protein TolC